MNGVTPNLNALRARGRMSWSDDERGWIASPDEVRAALAADGFYEFVREAPATTMADPGPADGAWRGVNPRTRAVASLTWTSRPPASSATVFIEIDGQSIARPGRDPMEEEGGQG
jgi:hypothetical protein